MRIFQIKLDVFLKANHNVCKTVKMHMKIQFVQISIAVYLGVSVKLYFLIFTSPVATDFVGPAPGGDVFFTGW